MQLSVRGKQLGVGNALRAPVGDSLARILGKSFGDALDVGVTRSREGNRHHAAVAVPIGRGIQIQAHGDAHGGLNMIYRRPDGNIGWIDPRGNLGQVSTHGPDSDGYG